MIAPDLSPHNPLFHLPYETPLEDLGGDYYDPVSPARFPQYLLRFRNDALFSYLGLEPRQVSDRQFVEAFGYFGGDRPCLALRYHGYQFGQYNPQLGDGRGFLYGQVRGGDGELYDFGTKGSGRTPYSRHADGRLTLKGGVREVLAAEALHRLGVRTSRCLSLVETGESLWREDEPSPTRASVMVRFSRSHLRFGTFERLYYHKRPDLIRKLLDHVIACYYGDLWGKRHQDALFFAALVQRVAQLAAQWMAAGFCHGVLNTDNMSITGESFDYGPYGFIPTYDRHFVAAYFDYSGRYAYGNQGAICRLNLEMLQLPLALAIAPPDLEAGLAQFDDHYESHYRHLMLKKLGIVPQGDPLENELFTATLHLLEVSQTPYHGFFTALTDGWNGGWWQDAAVILENAPIAAAPFEQWRKIYHQCLQGMAPPQRATMGERLQQNNPPTALLRPLIETVWEAIANEDNWQPFYDLVERLQRGK